MLIMNREPRYTIFMILTVLCSILILTIAVTTYMSDNVYCSPAYRIVDNIIKSPMHDQIQLACNN